MKIIKDRQVERLIRPAEALLLAETAFAAWGEKRVQMPPKVYLTLPGGDFRVMPAYIEPRKGSRGAASGSGVVGVKWISVYPDNPARRLPAVNGTLLLSDPTTGRLEAVLEANTLTALRTGAAGALATRLLARADASSLLLVGAGVQSAYQLDAHLALKKWSVVRVWSPVEAQARDFVKRYSSRAAKTHPGIRLETAASLETSVRASAVICTCTPSRLPLIHSAWVTAGTHINAIGADAPGKQELDIPLLRKAKVVVDDWEQTSHSGEINVACSKRQFSRKNIAGDLGTVLVKRQAARTRPEDITIFDSTGLAIQDMIMAEYVVKKAKQT